MLSKRVTASLAGLGLLAMATSGCAVLTGAAIGAGAGAPIGAGLDDKDRGRGAGPPAEAARQAPR